MVSTCATRIWGYNDVHILIVIVRVILHLFYIFSLLFVRVINLIIAIVIVINICIVIVRVFSIIFYILEMIVAYFLFLDLDDHSILELMWFCIVVHRHLPTNVKCKRISVAIGALVTSCLLCHSSFETLHYVDRVRSGPTKNKGLDRAVI